MGEIWSARHRSQGVQAAVKLLTRKSDDLGDFRRAFGREVSAVAGLDHPNIVVVYDHGEVPPSVAAASRGQLHANTPYLAMELVPGGSLTDRRGSLPWPALRRVLVDLLAALAHAHSRGVIHRDIKPGNVLLLDNGSVKLTDFGLAHATDVGGHRAEQANQGGTPAYMAPEQLQDEWRDFGPWTDLYALGCFAWSLATGRPPFHEGSWLDIMQAHVSLPPPAFQSRHPVPNGFEAWLRHLLAKSPHHRFLRAADAAWALLALGEPTEAQGAPATASPNPVGAYDTLDTLGIARTTLFWSDTELAEAVAQLAIATRPVEPRLRFEVPPMPQGAHRAERISDTLLNGAGLGLYGLRSIPIVGRRSEQDRLWRVLAEVHAERAQRLAHISGPVGCGKSRLAQWLCQRAHEVGAATILKASHAPFGGPSHGLTPMLANHLRCVDLDREAIGDRIRRALLAHGVDDDYEWRALTELIAPSEDEPEIHLGSPLQRYILIQRLVSRLCEERPVILWFEDVQWGADALGLARHLLELSITLPVLVLITSRDGVPVASPSLLSRVLERTHAVEIALTHLSPRDATALVRGLLGLDGDLAERVEERVAGNPLFAVQLVGDWVNRGLLVATEEGFRLKQGASIDLPDDLHALWSDALQPLLAQHPDEAIISLELAAALGDRVDLREWVALCKACEAPAPTTLTDSLARARLMRPQATGWDFTHAMLRESLERHAREAGRWVHHHQACCEMLRALHPKSVDAGRMGRHLMEAGTVDEATSWLLVGARKRSEGSEERVEMVWV